MSIDVSADKPLTEGPDYEAVMLRNGLSPVSNYVVLGYDSEFPDSGLILDQRQYQRYCDERNAQVETIAALVDALLARRAPVRDIAVAVIEGVRSLK